MKPAHFLLLASLASVLGAPAQPTGSWSQETKAGELQRLPDSCRDLGVSELEVGLSLAAAEERWNDDYRQGWQELEKGELDLAERSYCEALLSAMVFPDADIRFAETLDELGLVYFQSGEFAKSEAAQGAATAEILLALGPTAPGQTPEEKQQYSSSLEIYLGRLSWIYTTIGRASEIAELEAHPYRILGRGYLPDHRIASRLDWLISRYLLAENIQAADWLTALKNAIKSGSVEKEATTP